jgi:tellurite resistance protein TerC
MIFAYFGIPAEYQHRLLFWGVLGAIIMRAVMIAAGIALIERVDWIVYVFGAFLIVTAAKMLLVRHDSLRPDRNPLIKLTRRWFSVTEEFDGHRFFTRRDGRLAATPLFLALLLVESSDLLFAVDSIPAVLAVTRDPFLVFTSNVFAILGLRALYFALASAMARFRYLKMSLVFVLAFVGVKMILTHHHPIPTWVSLVVIGTMLSVGALASVLGGRKDTAALLSPLAGELSDLVRITYRGARRLVVLILGTTVLLIGAVLIVLPGPGLLTVLLGLVLLATEFVWARMWLRRVRAGADRVTSVARSALRGLNESHRPPERPESGPEDRER